jgi:hypothetical protein
VPLVLALSVLPSFAGCAPGAETGQREEALSGGTELPPGMPPGRDQPLSAVVMLTIPLAPDAAGKPRLERCSATRIGRRHFLTAAHCLEHATADAPILIANNAPTSDIGRFSVHVPLTLTQSGFPLDENDLSRADVAVLTVDARQGGYADLQALEDRAEIAQVGDGAFLWEAFDQGWGPIPLLLIGYGQSQMGDAAKGTAGTLRYGMVPDLKAWPAELGPPQRSRWLTMEGATIDRGALPYNEIDDTLLGDGVSSVEGDSGGPVSSNGNDVMAVMARALRGRAFTKQITLAAIPDRDWVSRVRSSPVIDVIASSPTGLVPTLEAQGGVVHINPTLPGFDAVYVKGFDLVDAAWFIADYQVPSTAIEVLPRDALDDQLELDTVKITLPPDAPATVGSLRAQNSSEVGIHDPMDRQLESSSRQVVEIHEPPRLAWRTSAVYRGLTCGETFGPVTASCAGAPEGMTEVTVVKSSLYQGIVNGRTVELEHIDSTASQAAWGGVTVVNVVPDQPLDLGQYQYATVSCTESGACAEVFIDFDYQEEQVVERAGALCRFRSRTYHDIKPWVWVLGTRLDISLPELMASITGFSGALLGVHDDVDDVPKGCDEVLAAHPDHPPFTVADDGTIVPAAGWFVP